MIEVDDILNQVSAQVGLIEDELVIQTLACGRSHPALGAGLG